MLLIAFPFQIGVDGTVQKVDDTSDEYLEQQGQVIVGTIQGERPMADQFGIPDAVFGTVEQSDIQACLDQYGPFGVTCTEVITTPITETEVNVAVVLQLDSDGSDQA